MKKKELLNLILSKIIEFFYKRAEFKKIKENRRKKYMKRYHYLMLKKMR